LHYAVDGEKTPIKPFDSSSSEDEGEDDDEDSSESENEDAFAVIVAKEKKKKRVVVKSWSVQKQTGTSESPEPKTVPGEKVVAESPFYDSDSDEEGIPVPGITAAQQHNATAKKSEPKVAHHHPSPLSSRMDPQQNRKLNPSDFRKPPKVATGENVNNMGLDQKQGNFPLKVVEAAGSVDVSFLDQTRDQDTITTYESYGPQPMARERYTISPSQELLRQKHRVVGFTTQEDGSASPALADSLTETTLTRLEPKETATAPPENMLTGFLMNACGFGRKKQMAEQSPAMKATPSSQLAPRLQFPEETPRISNEARLMQQSSTELFSQHSRFFENQQPLDPDALKQTVDSASEELPGDPTGMVPPSGEASTVQHQSNSGTFETSTIQTRPRLESDSESVDENGIFDRYSVQSAGLQRDKPPLGPGTEASSISSNEGTRQLSFVERIVAFGHEIAVLSPTSRAEFESRVAQMSPKSKEVLQQSIQAAEREENGCSSDSSGYLAEEEKKERARS